jgi:uncharacterized protein (DUF1015 family)
MADIRPFQGLRPKPELVQKVASPPYDVLNSQEARELAKDNPMSFLHVVKAEIDFGPDIDTHSDQVYKKGAENLQKFLRDGILIQDASPCFYIYQITMGSHTQLGLMLGASIDEYEKGFIKKHELTRRDKEDDRAHHVDILNANSGPVMLSYHANEEVDKHLETICSTSEPVYDFTAEDGIRHVLWVVSDPKDTERIQRNFLNVEAMYIADGHHRSAAAYRVRNIRKEQNPNHTGDELYNHFLAVAFPDNQLQILGYHRAVKDLAGLEPGELIDKLTEYFDVSETDDPLPQKPRHFTMFLDGKWYGLAAKENSFPADDPVLSLDVSILQKNILESILDLYDIRTNDRIDFIGGIRGTKELEKRCNQDMRIAFALYPTSIGQLMSVSDSGKVMPPKSTWFEPKLRSGMVIRSL